MRYLGVDYGSKRVGLAITDAAGKFAFPLSVLTNSEKILDEVQAVCKEHGIDEIVVGESKDFALRENEIMKDIKPFVRKLQELHFIVHMHPEFLTSMEAQQLQGKTALNDASAAALILKSYLDTKDNIK